MTVPDIAALIRANMPLAPVRSVPEIVLHTAHPASGLRRLADDEDTAPPPYWAYQWAGGTVLARYILDHPAEVAGRRVLDLGAGSGIVGIAAAKAGATAVIAAEIDPHGVAALALNAVANGVTITAINADLTGGAPPDVDLVAAGDVFYAGDLAQRVLPFLERCLAAGLAVLVGDPYRAPLPRGRLKLLAEYGVPDMGGKGLVTSGVFALLPR